MNDPFPISQVSPQAKGYLVKYVVDSMVTDMASSSGPHGISLSTTMDDDVFMDGTLREVAEEEEAEKTPDSHDEVSERSMQKVSPGAVREEVSQAIIDKKGTLIILKDSEDKVDSEGKETSVVGEKEEPVEADTEENELLSAPKEKETVKDDTAAGIEAQTTVVKSLSPKIGIKTDDVPQIKGIGSPKKAMASWISEEVKPEASEVISVSVKEVREMMTGGSGLFTFEEVQSKQSKSSLTQITLSESSTSSLAVVLLPPYLLHHRRHPQPTPIALPPEQQPNQSNQCNRTLCMANSPLTPSVYSYTCQTTDLCCNQTHSFFCFFFFNCIRFVFQFVVNKTYTDLNSCLAQLIRRNCLFVLNCFAQLHHYFFQLWYQFSERHSDFIGSVPPLQLPPPPSPLLPKKKNPASSNEPFHFPTHSPFALCPVFTVTFDFPLFSFLSLFSCPSILLSHQVHAGMGFLLSKDPAEPEEKVVVATETEAEPAPAPAESTGPTVNIQTAEAAKAEPVHATAELTVKTMSAEPAEGRPDRVVVLHRDISDNSSGDPPADSVNREKSVSPGSTPSLEQVQQRVSVKAEVQPAAETTLEFNESLSDGSSSPESAGLNLAAERGSKEVIDEEQEDAGVEGEALVSKNESDVFNFTVNPAFIRGSEKEEEQSTAEEAVERCLEALEELTGLKPTREGKQKETHGKRVQFSEQVEYFEEEEIPRELEDGIEEVDEEVDECSQTEDERQNTLKPLPFEKEKYHHEQMESSEDEVERKEEEEEMSAKGEEEEERENNCDVMVSEKEDLEPSPCDVTQSEPPPSASPLSPSPQAPAQSEVTPRGPCTSAPVQ
ncbi:hypothetical protein INR49_017741 [Caranx melampygus]|nr:hypothetical protein INR49_017741 [Caranx melampygus]